ncbi:MAG: hypothetical protein ABIT96_08485 [Ferruginibacter sp.]
MSDFVNSAGQLQHIKNMMERSSRFISLSGLSGVSAGICALAGAALAFPFVYGAKDHRISEPHSIDYNFLFDWDFLFNSWLFWIAIATLVGAVLFAFLFTWRKSKLQGLAIWGAAARRMLINLLIPLVAGGLLVLKLAGMGQFILLAPVTLLFYGLALINAAKYTLGEIRYLGYCQVILGIVSLWWPSYGLYFLAFGFGILHILYGGVMWYTYEKNPPSVHDE